MIDKIKEVIEKSDVIVITAGAGMGVDSGLPDFRSNGGFWNNEMAYEQIANPKWFRTDYKIMNSIRQQQSIGRITRLGGESIKYESSIIINFGNPELQREKKREERRKKLERIFREKDNN